MSIETKSALVNQLVLDLNMLLANDPIMVYWKYDQKHFSDEWIEENLYERFSEEFRNKFPTLFEGITVAQNKGNKTDS